MRLIFWCIVLRNERNADDDSVLVLGMSRKPDEVINDLLTWFPFRHTLHYPNGFFVHHRGKTLHNLYITETSIFVDNKTNQDSARNSTVNTIFGIAEMLPDVLHQSQ